MFLFRFLKTSGERDKKPLTSITARTPDIDFLIHMNNIEYILIFNIKDNHRLYIMFL